MQFALLGTLMLADATGRQVALPSSRQRVLMTTLLLHANVPVPGDVLAEVIWDGKPPPGATATLRSHVRRLRATVGPEIAARILTRDPGYLCEVTDDELDVMQFECLCRDASDALRAGQPANASATAARALQLWRGTPLLDVSSQTLRDRFVPRLEQLRLQAIENRIDAELLLGHHDRLAPELRELTSRHPLRERFHIQLMSALVRCGRSAEALAVYQEARRVLVEELGIEPGPELRRLQDHVLLADSRSDAASPSVRTSPSTAPPRQLPAGTPHFTGRQAELKILTDLLDKTAATIGTVVISAIDGTAGVGKTALAVHWAHLNADFFPDGQLYVDLRGFDPSGSPVPATTVVRRFLDALAIPAARIPADPDAQFGLYRSTLAGRRMLILLDNARDTDQVRPLLPGTAACRVLVTSRNQLTGLIALDGAVPLTIDLLTTAEARELLIHRLGPERADREQSAVDELVDLCARLPLALNIAAARALTRPNIALSTLVAELRDSRRRLDVLSSGQKAADIRAVFSWSYDALSELAAHVLRLVGVHPGPDIGISAAASLAGLESGQARQALDELTATRLLTEYSPGRYGMHDLLRTYAGEQAERHDGAAGRHAAIRRLLDHELHTAYPAALLIRPRHAPFELDPLGTGVTIDDLPDRDRAFAWYEAGFAGLHGVVATAADAGFNSRAWQIAWCWAVFLDARGHWRELAELSEIALSAARRGDDRLGQAFAHRWLGLVSMTLGSYADAHTHLDQAHLLFGAIGDNTHQGITHHAIAMLLAEQERFAEALQHEHRALELHRSAGNAAAQARALNAIGWYTANLGEHERALAYCHEALDLARPLNSPDIEAATLDSLAYAYRHLGRYAEAIACYRRVVDLRQVTRDVFFLSKTLIALGETHHETGDAEMAHHAWRKALGILDELHHPEAEEVRAKIHGLAFPRHEAD